MEWRHIDQSGGEADRNSRDCDVTQVTEKRGGRHLDRPGEEDDITQARIAAGQPGGKNDVKHLANATPMESTLTY